MTASRGSVTPVLSYAVGAFPTTPQAVPRIREFIRGGITPPPPEPEAVDDVILAATEACTNSVLHSSSERVRVRVTVRPEDICVEIEDDGPFQESGEREVEEAWDGPPLGGRGITIMVAVSDELLIKKKEGTDPGTLIRLVKRTS